MLAARPARMAPMTTVPERLQPLLDPASPVQQLARRLVDAGLRVLPRRGHRPRRAPRPHARRAPTSTSRRTPGPRWWKRSSAAVGRPRVAPGPALRHRRLSAVAACAMEITTFRAEVYRPESRKPEVAYADDIETDLSRRDFTVNAMAIRLPEPELIDPYGGARRSRGAPPPHAARAGGLVPRRSAAHAARGAVHRRTSSSCPMPELVASGGGAAPAARDRERGANPRRALEAAARRRPERGAVVPRRRPACPTSSSPSSTPCGSSRTRCTRTRTCSRTRSRSCATRGRELRVRLAALFHDVGKPKTRSFADRGGELPPPRGGRARA